MQKQELRNLVAKSNFIVVIGFPATGKTTLSAEIGEGMKIFHTDSYMVYAFDEALYKLIADLDKFKGRVMVEGIQGYRLLRKLAQWDRRKVDLVIECQAPKDVRAQRLIARKSNPVKSMGMDGMLNKIYNDFKCIDRGRTPIFVVDTE